MPKMIEREKPGAMLRRLTPGRARVGMFVYDDAPESGQAGYRAVPSHGLIVNVRSAAEGLALWRLVKRAVQNGEWKSERRRRVRAQPGVPAGAVADLGAPR